LAIANWQFVIPPKKLRKLKLDKTKKPQKFIQIKMESALKLLIKEAFKDNNFGQTFFDHDNPNEDDVIRKADLTGANSLQFKLFARRSEIELRKQFKNTKSLMGRLGVWAIDEYDDVMTSSILHLEPDQKKNPDPDKVIKNHPGFDPVFMKV